MKDDGELKFYIFAIVAVLILCIAPYMGGCNKQIMDTTYTFDTAIISVGGEWMTIDVASWTDFEDGDQLQIQATDGKTYLVHSVNCTLINSDEWTEEENEND